VASGPCTPPAADAPKEAKMSNGARRRYVLGFILAVLAMLIGIIILVAIDSGPTAGTTSAGVGTGGAGLADSSGSFTIEGNATEPISPGVGAPLDLKLTNPHDVPMSVTDLRVRVQKVSAPNADDAHPCAVGDFTVGQASSSIKITVAARATSTLSSLGLPRATWPQVGILERSVNQDGCKGASLTLGYAASGTLAQ
jgi:hypothetical protein